MTFTLWEGIYFDESGVQRACILVMTGDRVLSALDAESREPILDPASAIPIQPAPE